MKRILQNSFGKTILCLLVALMSGGTAWAQVAYRTIDFTTANSCVRSAHATNHGTTWTATNTSENFRVTLTSFNNAANANSGYWGYIACGRRTNSVVATITTGLIDKPITKVDLTLDYQLIRDHVNSVKLYVSSDYQNWGEAVGEFADRESSSVDIPVNKRAANLFYRIVVDCSAGNTLGIGTDNFVHISKVVFNKAADDPNAVPVPTITGNPEPTFQTQTLVTISRPNGADYVQYSTDGGTTWQTYSGTFYLTKTTTVMAKAIRGNKESEVVSKCFSHADDVVECTWNLRAAPTGGTPTASQALWNDDAEGNHTGAVMTLAKGGSSTNVNAHIGGNYNDGTYFYSGQKLTVGPVEGYTIVSVEFTCDNDYSDELEGCGWSNATVTRSGTKVTVTPIDGTQPIYMVVTAETHVTSVTVHYSPTEQPYIEVTEHEKNVSSASAEGTIELEYHGYFAHDVTGVTALDTDGEATWITAELNEDGNVAYRIDANTTTEQRIAEIHVQTERTDNYITVTQEAAIVLANADDNTEIIENHDGETCCIVLANRTLKKNGNWNTLCLPFNVELTGDFAGADVRTLDTEATVLTDDHLKLKIKPVNTSVLYAGTPYLIRWQSGDDIVEPLFVNVTVTKAMNNVHCDFDGGKAVWFKGNYESLAYSRVDQTVLFISNNKLYYVGNGSKIYPHRAYFKVEGLDGNSIKQMVLDMSEDDPDGINDLNANFNDDESIYNVAGQRLGKMQKGINIVNGKKIMVK